MIPSVLPRKNVFEVRHVALITGKLQYLFIGETYVGCYGKSKEGHSGNP